MAVDERRYAPLMSGKLGRLRRVSIQSPGLFIAFEGGDGAGKSTQAARLSDALESRGLSVLRTREPGGTPIGEKLRSLVLDHGHGTIDARTEALMFAAARAAHAAQVIRPALAEGTVVITDRYVDSSVAYQGAGRGLGAEGVLTLNEWATEGLRPDLTVLLDVDPSDGRQRRTAGDAAEDRLESEPDDFHSAIRHAFLDLAAAAPSSYLVLPANADIDSLAAQILERVQSLLGDRVPGVRP
jgi:dTMP kinase